MRLGMWRLLGVVAVIGLLGAPAWATYTLQITFEAPTYTTGALAGQDGWSALIASGEAVVVNNAGNGPTLPGTQCVKVTNVGGEIRLRQDFIADLVTYGQMIEFQYDIKNTTNKDSANWGWPTTFRTRIYDNVQGYAGIGNMHYDGGGGPACQAWASQDPDGDPGAWAPGDPSWTDTAWHTVKWTLIYDPANTRGLYVKLTFDGQVYPRTGWCFVDWNGAGTPGGVATRADWLELRLFADGGNDEWFIDNYIITASAPPELPVADTSNTTVTNYPTPGLVTLDGSASTAPPGHTIVRYIWAAGGKVLADRYTATAKVYLPAGQTSTVSLIVVDNLGNVGWPDTVDITVGPCTGNQAGYAEDWSADLDGISGFTTQYLEDAGAKMTSPAEPYGYYAFEGWGACPIDTTMGTINITLRFDNTAKGYYPTGDWWLRLHKEGGGDANYYFQVTADSGWHTLSKCILDPDENDPATVITGWTLQCVVWGGSGAPPFKMGIKNFSIVLPATVPVANAGTDQNVTGTCGQVKSVALNGSGSQNAVGYKWFEGGVQIATGVTPNVRLLSGVHYIVLEVQGTDPCARDTDEVIITVGGGLPLPIEIPMDTQVNYSGYGVMIYQPVYPGDPMYPWWSGSSEVAEIYVGQDIYGNPTDYTSGYMLIGQSWYHGPWVRLLKTCYGTQDLSAPNMHLKFTARYFQDASNWACDPNPPDCPYPYQDAPIMVTLRDAYGKRGCLGICYGPNFYDEYIEGEPNPLYGHQYPEWLNVDVDVQYGLANHPGVGADITEAGFDLTKVIRIEFHGTDWGGDGWDETNIKNLWIGTPPVCVGDVNCDGVINFGDINPFVLYLSNFAGWQGAFPDCNELNGDINCDGAWGEGSFGDINPFVALMTQCGGVPPNGCPCPGPGCQ